MEENFTALKKYNFWEGNDPELGYYLKDYTDKIFGYVGSKLVKVLIGQHRTGKSYILRQIAQRLLKGGVNPRNIFYINKEFTDFDFISD
jgi:predicted AAA+ superfamily ATPase